MEKVNHTNLVDIDIVEARQNYKLSLRKQKIEDYFMARRLADLKMKNMAISPYEVNPDMLILSDEVRNRQFNDIVINV